MLYNPQVAVASDVQGRCLLRPALSVSLSQHSTVTLWGFLFAGPHNKDYSSLESILGPPSFGKL